MDKSRIGNLNYPEKSETALYDFLSFYGVILTGLRPKRFPWYIAFCPFHSDVNTPNFFVNIVTGYYQCFACGKHGNYLDFSVVIKGNTVQIRTPEIIKKDIDIQRIIDYNSKHNKGLSELDLAIEKEFAIKSHELLLRIPNQLKLIYENRGLTLETIKDYQIGFCEGTLTIPIYDKSGKFISLKRHKKYQTSGAKNQLYPWKAVEQDYIILCEGEFDCLLLRQYGINAATQILGANSWEKEFNQYFNNKRIYLAYDNDEPGKKGIEKIIEEFKDLNSKIYRINWPANIDKDVTDYLIKYKRTIESFKGLFINV